MSNQMWGGRFTSGPDAIMEEINASIGFDYRLARQDIAGSKAHLAMLAKTGIVSQTDSDAIAKGLDEVAAEILRVQDAEEPRGRQYLGDFGRRAGRRADRTDGARQNHAGYVAQRGRSDGCVARRLGAEEGAEGVDRRRLALADDGEIEACLGDEARWVGRDLRPPREQDHASDRASQASGCGREQVAIPGIYREARDAGPR